MAQFNALYIEATIRRDITEEISNSFPAHEIAVMLAAGLRLSLEGPELSNGKPVVRDFDEGAEFNRCARRYGLEATNKAFGSGLSGDVSRAADQVEEMLLSSFDDVVTEKEQHERDMQAARAKERRSELGRRVGVVRDRVEAKVKPVVKVITETVDDDENDSVINSDALDGVDDGGMVDERVIWEGDVLTAKATPFKTEAAAKSVMTGYANAEQFNAVEVNDPVKGAGWVIRPIPVDAGAEEE